MPDPLPDSLTKGMSHSLTFEATSLVYHSHLQREKVSHFCFYY